MTVKYTTAGESHGRALIAVVEGIPAGINISTQDICDELAKRRSGIGRGERQKFEQDNVTILSGVIHGKTIASPIAIMIENSEWEKWDKIMSPDSLPQVQIDTQTQPNMPSGEEFDRLVTPRPGHADLVGMQKYGFETARPVLERASARETAARVAAGAVAKAFLKQKFNIEISARVEQFGSVIRVVRENECETDEQFDARAQTFAKDAAKNGETLGGVVKVCAKNVPAGFGSYVTAHDRLDAAIASALMSIQAVKGVEIGDGFAIAGVMGSKAHDFILKDPKTGQFVRETNHAGGIEGGMSNGCEIVAKIALKPISSVPGGLPTVNMLTGEAAKSHSQRSDISAVYPARIVAGAQLALVLADFATK